MANPLHNWSVNNSDVTTIGRDLRRPECVLAERSGDLWIADIRGLIHIFPDGRQEVIAPTGGGPFAPQTPDGRLPNIDGNQGFSMPNGLCFDAEGDIVVCNYGTDLIEHFTRSGERKLFLDTIDGRPVGKANFPAFDAKGRLYFTVSASAEAWRSRGAGFQYKSDGFIGVVDQAGARVVATEVLGANELRFDQNYEWLYVAETAADHITRFRVREDGSLCDREVYGPEQLGGAPDGIAFDAYGNLWTTLIVANRLVAITPERELLTVWEDGDPAVKTPLMEAEKHKMRDLSVGFPGCMAPRMASITFGGADLCTVYVGSLAGDRLPSFRSPVPGAPMPHWDAPWAGRL